MGRIRTVKPELFKHEELFDLEQSTGLPIRVAFIGLFTCCDREGRFKWRPRTLKLDVLPHDSVDFSRVLDALAARGFIRKYVSDSEEFGVIPTFHKHQVINNRETESDIPEPEESSYISMTSTREARVDDATGTRLVHAQVEGKGKEGKGRGKEGKGRAVALSVSDLLEDGLTEELADEWLAFRKKKGAALTATAWDEFRRQAALIGWTMSEVVKKCIARNWQGFEAEWVSPKGSVQPGLNKQEALEARNRQIAMQLVAEFNGATP